MQDPLVLPVPRFLRLVRFDSPDVVRHALHQRLDQLVGLDLDLGPGRRRLLLVAPVDLATKDILLRMTLKIQQLLLRMTLKTGTFSGNSSVMNGCPDPCMSSTRSTNRTSLFFSTNSSQS